MHSRHISDAELLLAADAELPKGRLREAREHLAACPACRARMQALAATSAEFQSAYREALDPILPGPAEARTNLRDAIFAESETEKPSLHAVRSGRRLRWAARLAALAIVVLGVAEIYTHVWLSGPDGTITKMEAARLPKPDLTPGAVESVPLDICLVDRKEDATAIPVEEREEVFRKYGVDYGHADQYELDHLITPALGGTNEVSNLWPEPYFATPWNAKTKDQLEDRLHEMVCSGQLDLPTAQRDISTDWIAAYKRYFHTGTPLAHPPPNIPDRTSFRNG